MTDLRLRHTLPSDWDSYWQEYELPDYVNYTPRIVATIQRRVDLYGCRVLEIGAGTGGNSSTIASLGGAVTALDFSMAALRRCRRTANRVSINLFLVQADARSLPFESGTFDLVFHQGFLEHFSDPRSIVREQRRILKSRGYILVDVPQRFNLYTVHKRRLMRADCWPYGGWEREFSLRELQTLLCAEGFQVRSAYGRGYYPRPLRMLRNLYKMEQKLLGRKVLPYGVWHTYEALWHRFEESYLGCNSLQCVGVLAQLREDK